MRYTDLLYEAVVEFIKAPKVTPEVEALLAASTKDQFLGDIVRHKKLNGLVVFLYDSEPVGFAIPRSESGGYYRTGPIFVLPQFRGKGISKRFVADFFKNKKGRAYIADSNKASQTVFTNAGFVKTEKSVDDDGEQLFLYTKAQ